MNVASTRLCMMIVAFAQAGCYAPRTTTPVHDWVRTELYFGLSRRDGSVITEQEWAGFVNTLIAPRFPAGFTVVPAQGYFGSRDQSPHSEPTRLLILFHDPSARDGADDDISFVAAEYARKFDQESVLRVDAPVRAAFTKRLPPSPMMRSP
jgi:hypothetical protein